MLDPRQRQTRRHRHDSLNLSSQPGKLMTRLDHYFLSAFAHPANEAATWERPAYIFGSHRLEKHGWQARIGLPLRSKARKPYLHQCPPTAPEILVFFIKNKEAALASNTQPKTRKQSLYASVGHRFAGRGDRFWKTIPPRWFYVGTDRLRIVERTDAGHSQGGIRVMNVARIMRPTLAAERTATVGKDEVRRAIVPRSHYDRIF